MSQFVLHGSLRAQDSKALELAKILIQASELVGALKACRLYAVSQAAEGGNEVWVTEIWDSKADHQASLQMPEVRALISQAMPLLDGAPQGGQVLDLLGGYIPQSSKS